MQPNPENLTFEKRLRAALIFREDQLRKQQEITVELREQTPPEPRGDLQVGGELNQPES